MTSGQVVFGYRHVTYPGFAPCPCGDPGNYVRMEVIDGVDFIVCWCGRRCAVTFEDVAERADFIASNLGRCLICGSKRTADGGCEGGC